MIVVHHLQTSQSERIVWLCEELGIPYELRLYQRDPATQMAPAEYRKLHAMGTAPVITDGHTVLAESGAIMDYIIHKLADGRLAVAPASQNYADYVFWYHFANASLLGNEVIGVVASMLGGDQGNPMIASVRERSDRAFALVENTVANRTFLAGEFTAADIINFFPLSTARAFTSRNLSQFPNLRAYLKRLTDRPAFRRAKEKADPDLPLLID
ncbi:MAG: glutathione S-transferase [Hyphomonadaceae bacterium]|nr:glutathione S-transferase [Hyphomonadaceae bacterium]